MVNKKLHKIFQINSLKVLVTLICKRFARFLLAKNCFGMLIAKTGHAWRSIQKANVGKE